MGYGTAATLYDDIHYRKCLTKLRMSSHDLVTEKGRHTIPKKNIGVRVMSGFW